MIVIVTEAGDRHADFVEEKLQHRGARVCRLDWSEFPQAASLSVEYRGGHKRVLLRRGGQVLELAGPSAEPVTAWLRRPSRPVIADGIADPLVRNYVAEECYQVIQDTWNALDIAFLPGPIHALRLANNKQLQLQLASTLGLEIPATLITNDADEFLDFYRRHGGGLIDKMPSTTFAASQRAGNEYMRFTEAVTTRDIGYVRRLRHSPMLFQAHVSKKFELRITVVGDQVLAAEIHSQSTRRTQLDWRHYDWDHTPYRVHDLPHAIRRACLALVARLGLRFGAIDMIVTPDDRYVFLEINPNGQWLWIERETGLPIGDAICDALTEPARPLAVPPITTTLSAQEFP